MTQSKPLQASYPWGCFLFSLQRSPVVLRAPPARPRPRDRARPRAGAEPAAGSAAPLRAGAPLRSASALPLCHRLPATPSKTCVLVASTQARTGGRCPDDTSSAVICHTFSNIKYIIKNLLSTYALLGSRNNAWLLLLKEGVSTLVEGLSCTTEKTSPSHHKRSTYLVL